MHRDLVKQVDISNLIIYPSILAVIWGISSVSILGVSLSFFYFWFTFGVSILNYSQPIINTALYAPIILKIYRNQAKKKMTIDSSSFLRMRLLTLEVEGKETDTELKDALEL
jgi:hypothetical protein